VGRVAELGSLGLHDHPGESCETKANRRRPDDWQNYWSDALFLCGKFAQSLMSSDMAIPRQCAEPGEALTKRCRQLLATGLKAEMKIDRATAFLGLFLFLFATRAITVAIGGFDEA
jgi:hypothetical protein